MDHTVSDTAAAGIGLVMILFFIVFGLACYLFTCFCFKRICEKCGKQPGILIWIPIVNLIPVLEVAKLPVWTIVFFLIPFVSLVMLGVLGYKLAEARGKNPPLGILLAVPLLNLVMLLYLAFSE